MELTQFTEDLAKTYASWRYSSPYDIYNLPSWEQMLAQNSPITTPQGRANYYAYTQNSKLISVVSFKKNDNNIYVGIALCPDCCGRGLGAEVLNQALKDYDQNNNRTLPFYVEIREWNQRSIKTCQKCGFKIIDKKICKGKDDDFLGVCLERN